VLAVAGDEHRGRVDLRPSVATLAVGVEPVAVLEQADEGAEVDHWARVAPTEVHHGSGTTLSVVSGFLIWRGAIRPRPAPPDRVRD